MKYVALLFLIMFLTVSCVSQNAVQDNQMETGLALRHVNLVEGMHATHRTHPLGTTLLITNEINGAQIEVQVGGRPDNNSNILVELSHRACEYLEISHGVLTRVSVGVVTRLTLPPEMLPRLTVRQTGRVLAHNAGTELVAYHPSIAIGKTATLTNTANDSSIVVTFIGNIPAKRDSIMVISRAAADALGIDSSGEIHLITN